jgi:hypothetical protein
MMGASVGNIGEHPHEVHHHHIPFVRHDDPVAIDRAVDEAFISAFRVAMFVSAGMVLTSAIAAAIWLQGNRGEEPGNPGPHATG